MSRKAPPLTPVMQMASLGQPTTSTMESSTQFEVPHKARLPKNCRRTSVDLNRNQIGVGGGGVAFEGEPAAADRISVPQNEEQAQSAQTEPNSPNSSDEEKGSVTESHEHDFRSWKLLVLILIYCPAFLFSFCPTCSSKSDHAFLSLPHALILSSDIRCLPMFALKYCF